MDEFLNLHHEEEHYFVFAKEFIRIMVGKKKWKHQSFRVNLSEFCSASDEAFCLLTLENNYMRWCGMVESGDYGDKGHTAPPPLYTNAGKSNRKVGTAKPFQGWSAEGYERFDALHKMVKADRAKTSRCRFEEMLKKMLMEENSGKRQRPVEEEDDGEDVVYPAHDFADVDRGGILEDNPSRQDEHQQDSSSNDDDSVAADEDEEDHQSQHTDNKDDEEEEEQEGEEDDNFEG